MMDIEKRYHDKVKHIKKLLLADRIGLSAETTNAYAYFSANLAHFMPLLGWDRHEQLYHQFREQHAINALEAQEMDREFPQQIVGWEGLRTKLTAQPGIICTFHFGAYQLINYLLLRDKLKFALLVGDEVLSSWDTRYPKLMEQMQQGEKEGRFQLLNADEQTALRRIYRLVQAGYLVVIYADGLTGTDTNKTKNRVRINFLGQRIHVPGGAATLAHGLQCPIYPLLAVRKEMEIVLETIEPIMPTVVSARADFVKTATTELFGFLSAFLMHAPQQWSVWTQLQRLLQNEQALIVVDELNDDIQHLDKKRYGLLCEEKAGNNYFLLNKCNYQLFNLNKVEYQQLLKAWFK